MIGVSRASSTRSYQLLATTTITSTGSQTYTVPVGMVYAEVELWALAAVEVVGRRQEAEEQNNIILAAAAVAGVL